MIGRNTVCAVSYLNFVPNLYVLRSLNQRSSASQRNTRKNGERHNIPLQFVINGSAIEQFDGRSSRTVAHLQLAFIAQSIGQPRERADVVQPIHESHRIKRSAV